MKQLTIRQQHSGRRRTEVTYRYLSELGRLPRGLGAAQEKKLFASIRAGDRRARERLIQCHLRFVVTVAKQFRYPGIDLDDLISEGNSGLVRAVETFDHHSGNRFISYAVWWIRQRIQAFIEQHGHMLPRHCPEHLSWTRYRRVYDPLFQQLEREPTHEEVADALTQQGYPTTAEQVDRFASQPLALPSLDHPFPGSVSASGSDAYRDGASLLNFLPSETVNAEEQLINKQEGASLRAWLTILSEREQYVIRAYYGLDGDQPRDLVEIAQSMGAGRSITQRLREQALIKLRMHYRRQQSS